MKDYLEKADWSVVEEGFHPEYNQITESIFSLGNGYMGHRGMFEEKYTGETLQGSYLAGIYYPDKTRVGWWKNGYPEYFAKVLNSVFWIGISVEIDGNLLDLNEVSFMNFRRELDMKSSTLSKEIEFKTKEGWVFKIESERFCSAAIKELGCVQYSISSENFSGTLKLISYLDFNVLNQDSNYDESFWENHASGKSKYLYVAAKTRKTDFHIQAFLNSDISSKLNSRHTEIIDADYVADSYQFNYQGNEEIKLTKKVVLNSSFNVGRDSIESVSEKILDRVISADYHKLKKVHSDIWSSKWAQSDIIIKGDIAAQQGIRFNIFHLHQTYSGADDRLNIGPKGFTGEKYGGSTYWDTEAYCLPFYMSTAPQKVAKNLLIYRYKHLQKAIENAEKLGFINGAALFPMVTMNGEECHNEWEITFEEIHRNGAIAYAMYDYINYTGDKTYLIDHGVEVLIAISKFWSQRVNYSNAKNAYVMLGVTGPNEYENNVNNNWYTNYIAKWCLQYTIESIQYVKDHAPLKYETLISSIDFNENVELEKWRDIIAQMYLPYDTEQGIYLQQDGFLDKEIKPVLDLDRKDLPINQNWSWDRILRSCFIKQADVLQGLYFFENDFSVDILERNFDFYEPITVHESSLSPCVHAILACKLNKKDKAYEMYLRTSRLDLDDYNNDTEDGLHITSMAGTWLSIVKGFGGMRVLDQQMSFAPSLPNEWQSLEFKIGFGDGIIDCKIEKETIQIFNDSDASLSLKLYDQLIEIEANTMGSFSVQEIITS